MKKINNIIKRIVVAALIALLTMTLVPGPGVMATDGGATIKDLRIVDPNARIDTNTLGSLTVKHEDADGKIAPHVTSNIYLIATVDELGIYTITDEFKGYFTEQNLSLDFFNNGFECDKWKECVSHTDQGGSNSGKLESYIKEHSITPKASGEGNDNGEKVYSGLTLGIYFVESGTYEKDNYIHYFINFLYPVPLLDKHEGEPLIINYHPVASPKKAKYDIIHCGIRKLWDDSSSNNRPATVTFRVYADGVETSYSPVTLSAANNWQVKWTDKGNPKYTIEEIDNPDGYRPEITYEKIGDHDFIFTCINHYSGGDNPPPPDNPPPDNPPPGGGVLGAIRDLPQVLGAVRALPQVLGARRLPQTGQLWWPLPILVIAGIFFIVKGIKKNAKMKAQNN